MKRSRLKFFCTARKVAATALFVFSTGFLAAADYSSTVLSQQPVGYWRLNETTPPPVPQSVANNIGSLGAAANGTYTNGVIKGVAGAIAGSPADTAAGFPALIAGNRVLIPYQPQWNIGGPFSVEFWAKPGQSGSIVSPAASTTFLPGPGTRSGWLFYQGDSTLGTGNGWYFRLYRGASDFATCNASTNLVLDTNAWYHVVGSFDGTNVNLYVNGTLASSVPLNDTYRPVTDTNAPMTFGSRSDGASSFGWFSYFGSIDEPAFYTNALGAARVLAHYQAGTNAAPPTPYRQVVLADAPVGYWPLNEPADAQPVASNSSSSGSALDGYYVYDANPGVAGPQPPAYPGFESTNTSVGLDGGSGYVSLPALNLNTNTVTITAWINRNGDQNGNTAIVLNRAGSTVGGLKFDQSQQELSYNWADDPATTSFRSYLGIPEGQWVFAALVLSPDHAVLALQDGTGFYFTTNFTTHSPQMFESETRIGSDSQSQSLTFNGDIDEVAVFNRSLSLGEVFSQYASAVGGVAPQSFAGPLVNPAQPVVGDQMALTVDVGGTPPLSYQWRKNGTNIGGATAASYQIASASTNDSGNYDVVVTNAYGSVTNPALSVTVSPLAPPVITQDPQGRSLFPGGLATFQVSATGGQLTYQWYKDGAQILSATSASYIINGVASGDSGVYTVVVTNSLGSVTSAPASLTIVNPAAGCFEEAVFNDGPYAWWRLDEAPGSTTLHDSFGRHDGVYIGPHTLGVPGVVSGDTAVHFDPEGYGQIPYSPALNLDTFTVEVWARAPASEKGVALGVFSSFSSAAHSNGRGIGFVKADADSWRGLNGKNDGQPYYYNDLGLFVPDRWTHWAAVVSGDAVTWYLNGSYVLGPYPGAYVRNLSAPFCIGAFQPGGALNLFWEGDVDEVVYFPTALTSAQIQAHYIAALYCTNTPPLFTLQPASQTVIEGGTATFTAKAEGSVPIQLQWNQNGVPIPGATNGTLTLSNVTYIDRGTFVLTATNAVGGSNSALAILTVAPPPSFACLTNALVLHLKFDGDYTDSSGRSNNASPVGAVTFVPGILGQALHYQTDTNNSIYNYVTLGLRDDLQFSSNVNFSVSYWIRIPSNALTGDLPFLSTAQFSFSDQGYTFAPSFMQGGWSWSLNQIGVYGGPAINDGQWHNLVHSFDRNGFALTYLDGVLVDSRPDGGYETDVDTGAPLNIGQSASGDYQESAEADIDDIGIWRRALTSYEAQSIYYAGKYYHISFDTCGPVPIDIRKAAQDIGLIWQQGDLQQAGSVTGPWEDVSNAPAPYLEFSPANTNQFFRVKQ